MTTILIRTVIVYIILILSMRFMGKRQIGELRISEFVVTLIISELASYPVMDGDIPLLYVFIPIITLISAEVFVSYLCTKNKTVREFVEPSPCLLIEKGVIKQENLGKVRITLNELVSEVRQKGYGDLSTVDYAVLESNGRLSVIAKGEHQSLTVGQAGHTPENGGIAHPVVTDGELNLKSIAEAGTTPEWVLKKLSDEGYTSVDDVFLMLLDNNGKLFLCKSDKKRGGKS